MTKFADTEEKRRLTVTDILIWSLFEQKKPSKKSDKLIFDAENCFGYSDSR